MESQEVIDAFRQQLDQVSAQGVDQLQVSALRNYLNALERDAGASQEYRRQKHEGMLANYAAQSQHSIEMLKAVLEAGKSALHALLIINGGAVIALLGVLSNLAGKDSGAKFASMLALPLLLFGVGVLSGAIGFSFRYFSQACYSESEDENDKYQKWGAYLQVLGYCVGIRGVQRLWVCNVWRISGSYLWLHALTIAGKATPKSGALAAGVSRLSRWFRYKICFTFRLCLR